MDRRRAAGVLLALAACVAYATAAPTTASNHTSLDLYDGAPDGCYYNFQHYGEGDRIMTNEPCLNCTCHNRMLMCYLRVCPFTKPIGQDCTIEKRADQCCPIVTCPDVPVDLLTSTTTSPAEYGATGLGKLDKYGCSIHGKYFPEGSKVPPTPNKPCEHCYCIRNMTTCVMQECTLHVDGCTPIYHKDVCCPVRYSCDHPEDEMPLLDDLSTTVRPTPGFLLTTTTLSPVTQMSQDCLYENQIIPDGALIKTEKACDHCYCMKGDIVCVVQGCGTPMENEGKNCTALPPREGVCCPDTYICEGDESTTGTYEGLDYTTKIDQEKLTTLTPPRRAGSEGSGYRNEPDDIPNTESPTVEDETEGSGGDQVTIHSTAVPEVPEIHKIESTDKIIPSTEEPNEFITIASTKEPVSEISNVSDEHQDINEQFVQSTSSYASHERDESSTVKGSDEDIGSGEEDFITSHEIDTSPSSLPSIGENEPTIVNEQTIATTESHKKSSESDIKESTTSQPIVKDDDNTHMPSVATEKSEMEITTLRLHLDEEQSVTTSTRDDDESLQTVRDTTTSVPNVEVTQRTTTTDSGEFDNTAYQTDASSETETKPSLDLDYSTRAPGMEEDISTDSHVAVTDGFEGTSADIDTHHITITTSTPLLEEIEKDTTEEIYKLDESLPDKHLPSTTVENIPTEEAIDKNSLKPDFVDETISTNIPTTISDRDTNDIASTETGDVEITSESQQYSPITNAPIFEDDHKKITKSDDTPTYEPEKDQDVEISSESQQYSPTTSAPAFVDDIKKTTKSDFRITTESERGQDVEISSEPQQYLPTSASEEDVKKTTQLDDEITIQTETVEYSKLSTESQQYPPTTSAPVIEEDANKITKADSAITDEPVISEEVSIATESQPHSPTTPAFEEDIEKTTPTESIITTEPKTDHDVTESSGSQQGSPTTTAFALEEEFTKATPPDYTNTADINVYHFVSDSTTKLQQSEFTTAEPDKGLNTIPSGSVEEETTKSTELETELDNKYTDNIETATDISKLTNLISDTTTSSEDQFKLTTEPAIHETTDVNTSKIIDMIAEQTTMAIDVTDKMISTITSSQSSHTDSPTLEEVTDTSITSSTEKQVEADAKEPSSTSSYEYSTQAPGLEDDSNIDKHGTSAPSYETISVSTAGSLEENEIINEPRIPGEGDCLFNGVTYRNESVVPSTNKCQSGCRCISSIIKCDPIICSPPPEYMDNCQTTYDSPDSCCPTYVCDHKTETMPPQSHSQMTGTEKEPPIKCNGDECVPSFHPSNVPEQPIVDSNEKCTGDQCITTDQLCNEEGCQASPVKPCEGSECEITYDNIPPQKQQPCGIGEECNLPATGCIGGECKSEEDPSREPPHDIDSVDIEKECTEKSCKRKGDSGQVQQVPQICSDGDCQSISGQELTTTVSILSNEQPGQEMPTKTNKPDTVTQKSTEISSTVTDSTTNPIEDITEQHATQSELATTHSTLVTYLPDQKQDITENPQKSTQVFDEKLETETSTNLPETHVTVKLEDSTNIEQVDSMPTENSDVLFSTTQPPEITSELEKVTKLHQEKTTEETTTFVTEKETEPSQMIETEIQTTKSTEKEYDEMKTSVLDEIFTEPSTGYTESIEVFQPTERKEPAELTTVKANFITTISNDIESQEVTKSPTVSQTEDKLTTKLPEDKTTNYPEYETTKFLDSSEKFTTPADIYDSDLQKPDGQVITESSPQNEVTTARSEDKTASEPEIVDIQDVTKSPEDTISEEITTNSLGSRSTEPPQKVTTVISEDLSTETPKPSDTVVSEGTEYVNESGNEKTSTEMPESVSDETLKPHSTEKQDISQPSDIIKDEDTTTQVTEPVSKETYDENIQEYTKSTETTENEDTTSKLLGENATEISIVDKDEQTSTESEENIVVMTEATSLTDSSNLDEMPHDVSVTQKTAIDETGTKLSKLDEFESHPTTKLPDDFETEEITTEITTAESDKIPSDLQTHGTTESSSEKSDSQQQLQITTLKYTDEEHELDSQSHSLEKITTAVPDTILEMTTSYVLDTNENINVSEQANELTTEKQEQSQTTKVSMELITESIMKSTTAFPVSSSLIEEDVTSHIEQNIPTKSPVDIVTEQELNSEMTDSSYPLTDDSDLPAPETNMSTSDKTVTIQKIQDSGTPDIETEVTTVESVNLYEITHKPLPTSTSEGEKLEETAYNTEIPIKYESDKYTTPETSTLKFSDTTEVTVEIQTEKQPVITESPKEDQSGESLYTESPGKPSVSEEITTVQPIEVKETNLPEYTEITLTSHSDGIGIHEPTTTEPSKMGTQEKDESETETSTLIPEYASEFSANEKPADDVSATEISDKYDKHSTPSESESHHTEIPSYISSTTIRHENVDSEYTTLSTKISDLTTGPSNTSEEPTEPSSSYETQKLPETTQKNLEPEVTEKIDIESSTRPDDPGEIATEKIISETSIDQESSTHQPSMDLHKLSTVSQPESFTEISETKTTTQRPIDTESFTKPEGHIMTDTVIESPENEDLSPMQPTATESAETVTKAQDQDTPTKGSDLSVTSPSVIETTDAIEKFPESSSQPVQDTEKSSENEYTSTPKEEFLENTTSTKIEGENVLPVDKDIEIPSTDSDQTTVEVVTETQSAPIDVVTQKQETSTESVEEDFIPSKTIKPEVSQTKPSSDDGLESDKSTSSPMFVEEASVLPEQTMNTTIEPHLSEEQQPTTVIVTEMNKVSTPKVPELESQTTEIYTPTEKPLQAEVSSETSKPEKEKSTTLKPTTDKAEEVFTSAPNVDKFTMPPHKPTGTVATEQPRPIPTEDQHTDDILTPDEESSIPSSGPSGYGQEPDYMEEDQTFGPGTCRYGGKVYVSAQQIPRDDPCDFCFCFRSDIICLQQSCPPPIHGCHEEPIQGFCCPRYECPVSMATTVNVTTTTTTTTTTLPPHFPVHSYKGSAQKRGCLIKGHSYKVGEVVRASSGPCLHCTCGGDGQMKCDPKQCTPEPMLRQMIAAAVSAKRRR